MKIREGSLVIVQGGFGIESPKKVRVDGLGEKKGHLCFDYDTKPDGSGRWAYSDQIIKVIKY